MLLEQLKSLGKRFAGTALLFSGLVGLGTSIVLIVSSCVGYLPYSDRPGPGWWGRIHWPSWTEFSFYIEFAPWFVYFCLYFGLGLFVLSLVLGFASSPKWLNRLLGGAIAAIAAGMAVAAGGWYFALAAIGPDVAIILGLLYGIFLFPRFVLPRLSPIPIWGRVALIAGAAGLFVYWIVSPLLPRAPVAALNYSVERVTPGDKPVIGDVGQDKALADAVAALNLHGDVHGGIGGGVSGDTNVPAIDLEMIALEPITRKTKLLLPKTGYVVYVLDKGVWTAYPAIAKSNKRKLTVEPGTDPSHEGAKVTIDDAPGSDAFIWYPVISKSNR